MAFDLPRNTILPVDSVDVRLVPEQHPFERDNLPAIEENWLAEKAAKPAVFDGTVVLLSDLAYRDERLVGRCHAVRFATFLYWRGNRSVSSAEHAFAHAVLVAEDNALVAIRMGPHTINAGRVYFAAGSFEPDDFADGLVQVDANMIREVGEETGLDISNVPRGKRYYALSTESGTVVFRRYHYPEKADELAAKIDRFVAADENPEISGAVIIRNAEDLPEGLMPHMKAIVEWHFSGAE